MTLTERLRVLPESGDLEIAWTMNDPAYYAEPVRGRQVLQSTNQELTTYDCIPEALPSAL